MPRVINMHLEDRPADAVYIGRPSKWGNPFPVTRFRTRDKAIEQYTVWLLAQPKLVDAARRELAGKDLLCFCSPQACHGDVLLRVANS
jgi:hypothetical protein